MNYSWFSLDNTKSSVKEKTYLSGFFSYGKLEDTKGIIRNRKSKDGQYVWRKEKGQIVIYKTLHRKIDQYESH